MFIPAITFTFAMTSRLHALIAIFENIAAMFIHDVNPNLYEIISAHGQFIDIYSSIL